MAKYIDQPLGKYIEDLSAKLPAPGGGSASALAGVVGVSCLLMVANFTVDKKGYESCQDEIKSIIEMLEKYRRELTGLIDLDVETYTRVRDAYKSKDDNLIQNSLKSALLIPERMFLICSDALSPARRLAEIGNKNLVSDITCGVLFLQSAILSAKENIEINLKSITEKNFIEMKNKLIDPKCQESKKLSDEILKLTFLKR